MSTGALRSRLEKIETVSTGSWSLATWLVNQDAIEKGLPLPYPNLPPAPQDILAAMDRLPAPDRHYGVKGNP